MFKDKKLDAECKEVRGSSQDLLPGRFCYDSYNCKNSLCKESQCRGMEVNEHCHHNTDCDYGLYCQVGDKWPFVTKCTKQKSESESCENDFQCQNNNFCWYPDVQSKKDNKKSCLAMYQEGDGKRFGWSAVNPQQPTEDDFKRNGLYCKSGLAYPISDDEAKCTSFEKM